MATIMYVDDEEAIRRAVGTWLTRRGHVVHAAADAAAARAIVQAEALDGVFIDLWLGDDSGLDLFKWIEAHDSSLAQRVAFVTGDMFNEALGESRLARPVLTKPFALRQLEELATSWAAEARTSQDARRPNTTGTDRDERVAGRGR